MAEPEKKEGKDESILLGGLFFKQSGDKSYASRD